MSHFLHRCASCVLKEICIIVLCQAHKDGSLQQLLSGENEAYDYDLIVIGGGSGGLACSKVTSVVVVGLIIFAQANK